MVLKVYKGLPNELNDIVLGLELHGVAVFGATKAVLEIYYNKYINNKIDYNCALSYVPHPDEGYYYFVYDLDRCTNEEAQQIILEAILV